MNPGRPAPARVGLWAHRWDDLAGRTGVGRYALELGHALAALDAPGLAYELRGGRGPAAAEAPALPFRPSWPPRRLLHGAWMTAHRPRYEHVAPPVDLLHVLFPSFPVPTRLPLVGTVHDLFVLHHPEWFEASERRAVLAATTALIEQADHLVCVSGFVAAQLHDELGVDPAHVTVVHHGITPRLTAPAAPADRALTAPTARPYVLALGTVGPRKNLGVLLDALRQVPAVDLVVVGPVGPAAGPTLGRIDALGLGDRVHVLGPLDDASTGAILQGAVALVHPSLDEGFGLPPVEAMAAGVPAIVARSGGLPEATDGAALLVGPTAPEAWAAAIEQVRTDGAVRRDLVRRGRERAARLTWAESARATAAVHELVLARRRA